jgi:hypothetical protein
MARPQSLPNVLKMRPYQIGEYTALLPHECGTRDRPTGRLMLMLTSGPGVATLMDVGSNAVMALRAMMKCMVILLVGDSWL